jgi:P27 family predicted phage terminase small subunit
MGARGPAPKPTHLKLLEGNPGKRPLNQNEPKPKPIAPKPPSWLDKEAKKEWKRVAPELERLGLLTVVDGAALAAYCQAYSRWVEAEKFLSKHGTVFKTPNGYIQQLPQVSIAQKYLQIVKSFCQEFGLTPSARSRMTLPSSGGEDDDDFFGF